VYAHACVFPGRLVRIFICAWLHEHCTICIASNAYYASSWLCVMLTMHGYYLLLYYWLLLAYYAWLCHAYYASSWLYRFSYRHTTPARTSAPPASLQQYPVSRGGSANVQHACLPSVSWLQYPAKVLSATRACVREPLPLPRPCVRHVT